MNNILNPFFGALISGVLCILAFPGSPVPLLAFVCMAPWLASLKYAKPLQAAISGLLLACLYAIPCTWDGIYTAAKTLSNDPVKAGSFTIIFFIPYLIPFTVVGLHSAISELTGIRRAVIGSAIWVAAMYAMPSVFPVTPGLMLHVFPSTIQLADVGGVPLVNFILFLINFLIAEIFYQLLQQQRPFRELGILFIIIAVIAGYGWIRLTTFQSEDTGRTIKVALIQPNLPRGVNETGLIRDNRIQVISALELTRRLLKTNKIDLAVFPETAVSAPCSESGLVFRKLSVVAKETGVAFLYQCLDCKEKSCFNAARMILPNQKSPGLYRKRALIPFLETIPTSGFYRLLTGLAPVKQHFQIGTEKIIFNLTPTPLHDQRGIELPSSHGGIEGGKAKQGIRVMPLICYDVHFPELVREGEIGDVIAVMANDQSFGKSRIGYLDYAMNIFRAIEIRRPLLRVTNTGPSAIIEASGETVPGTLTQTYKPEARAATLPIPSVLTFYARYGDVFLYFLYCIVFWELIKSVWLRIIRN